MGLVEQCLGSLLSIQLFLQECFYVPGTVSLGDHVMQPVQLHFPDRGFRQQFGLDHGAIEFSLGHNSSILNGAPRANPLSSGLRFLSEMEMAMKPNSKLRPLLVALLMLALLGLAFLISSSGPKLP